MSGNEPSLTPGGVLYDDTLSGLIAAAVSRFDEDLEQAMPFAAAEVGRWQRSLYSTGRIEDYFKNPLSFPLLLLPWWLSRSIRDTEGPTTFDRELVYSSMNGYFFIRLVDNVMDREETVERSILPAASFFHSRFEAPYREAFSPGHPFWNAFESTWLRSADAAIEDARLEEIREGDFMRVCAQKFAAGKLPVIAVCQLWGREELIGPWERLIERLGAWHQMQNDLRDWHKDPDLGIRTYLLSEADRRRGERESLMRWMIREGNDWGAELLQRWMTELEAMAAEASCPLLTKYLQERTRIAAQERAERRAGFEDLARLARAFGEP